MHDKKKENLNLNEILQDEATKKDLKTIINLFQAYLEDYLKKKEKEENEVKDVKEE